MFLMYLLCLNHVFVLGFTFKVPVWDAPFKTPIAVSTWHQTSRTCDLGFKKSMRACNMHSSANTYCILRLARTKVRCQVALASQPSASRPMLVKEPCAQKLTALAWQTSGLKTQVSVVTAVYTGSRWSIRTWGPSDVLGQKKSHSNPISGYSGNDPNMFVFILIIYM